MKRNKKGLILSLIGLLGLIVITAGVTYAFFNYAKQGTTENSITTGTITFLYTEVSEVGRGISINDAYPVSDEIGKVQTGEGKVFDFKVTSTTPTNSSIPYEITARKKVVENMLDEEAVKLYLTKVSGDSEEEVVLDNYSNLTQTAKVSADKYTEKTIYNGRVPAGSSNYEQAFRLRMWIDDSIDFSPVKDEEGNDTYPYNNKTFTVTVNVYANAKVVTEEDILLANSTAISSVKINDVEATAVDGQNYNYKLDLPEGTTSTTINVETESPYASVSIEKVDSLVYNSNIKRLAVTKDVSITEGDNYFRIKVTSEDKQAVSDYIINLRVPKNLSDKIMDDNSLITEIVTLSKASPIEVDETGLYVSDQTNSGASTYFYRGNVENNYVTFANQTWRIVRINEDGTVRMILEDGINNNQTYLFQATTLDAMSKLTAMYYSTSNVKKLVDSWYQTNLSSYDNLIATEMYCEQDRVVYGTHNLTTNNEVLYTSYTPTFKCGTDNLGYGILNLKVGLISLDEAKFAGEQFYVDNADNYLTNSQAGYWTMSPAGQDKNDSYLSCVWPVKSTGAFGSNQLVNYYAIRPVINLNSDIKTIGAGTSTDPYIVQ